MKFEVLKPHRTLANGNRLIEVGIYDKMPNHITREILDKMVVMKRAVILEEDKPKPPRKRKTPVKPSQNGE